MSVTLATLLADANSAVRAYNADQAIRLLDDPSVVFVDVRNPDEVAANGRVPGAIEVPRGNLEFFADGDSPAHHELLAPGQKLVVYCASGGRSALAAKTLIDMGYRNVAHIAGGFVAWQAAGGPVARRSE